MEAYLEEKVEPLIGIVEPSMYAGRFEWNKNLPVEDVRPYCKEIIMNMIAVHAEVAHVIISMSFYFSKIETNIFLSFRYALRWSLESSSE